MQTRQQHRILQGANYDGGDRYYTVPFEVRAECGQLVRVSNGQVVNMKPVAEGGDLMPRDFTDCEARMQLRVDVLSPFVLEEFSKTDGTIAFDGERIYFPLDAARTSAMKYGNKPDRQEWSVAIGQLEIIHPGGRVERLAEMDWFLDPESTR